MEPFKPGILSEESAAEQVEPGNGRECGCGRWYHPDAACRCHICSRRTCGECLKPAIEPVTGEEYEYVCETCRASIDEINAALLFYAHRRTIVEGLPKAIAELESLNNLSMANWGGPLGRTLGTLSLLNAEVR